MQTLDRPATGPRTPPPPVRRRRRTGNWLVDFYSSAVGKKYVMAVTGIALLGFVLVHMIGNLHLYEGEDRLNEYAEGLRNLGEPLVSRTLLLWLARGGLITAFVFHIHSAYGLTRMNQAARRSAAGSSGYVQDREWVAANFASRTMRWTGVIVLLYLVFHLLDLTWGQANPDFVRGEVYDNVVASFERVPVAVAYVVANLALGIHIFHGAWSLFQSLGVNNPRFNHLRRWFAVGFAAVITVGNAAFPIMVQAGVVQ